MRDEEYLFISDSREKKRTARGAYNKRTHAGKGGRVKFPSDYKTRKELESMNGETKSYRLNEPMSWAEFKEMPEDIKGQYIRLLQSRYNATDVEIGKMMGISPTPIRKFRQKQGIPALGKGCRTSGEWTSFVTVIDVYYKVRREGRELLHYIKYVGDEVIVSTEDDPQYAERGLYDHGRYPYVFDPLFPIEGSPCGYGFVDLCRSPQTQIDLLQTAFVKNAMVGAVPRYFKRVDGAVNVEEFLDLSNPLVTVDGNLGEDSLRPIQTNNLDGNYIGMMDRAINELRETTGNTETSAGQISSGVTAASAIAALQEASGKGSRDSTRSSYNRYAEIVNLCIELIRQFYDLPRQFRITGQMGQEQFVTYTNAHIKPQAQGMAMDIDMGYRLPVFDIKISAQKKSVYTKVTQNELALQFYQMGFFNPSMVDQALMTLGMMEFDGKDSLMQKISAQGTLYQKCIQYMQMALALAQKAAPEMVEGLSQDIMMSMGGGVPAGGLGKPQLTQGDNIAGNTKEEPANVEKARKKASQASQPGEA